MSAEDRRLFHIALAAVAAITMLHVVVLLLSPLDLYPDEAQYWWWSQNPASRLWRRSSSAFATASATFLRSESVRRTTMSPTLRRPQMSRRRR